MGALGVTASTLPFLDSVAPPGSTYGYPSAGNGYCTMALLSVVLVLTYAIWRAASPKTPQPILVATVICGLLAITGVGYYVIGLMPTYIYEKTLPTGEKIRTVVADGDSSLTADGLRTHNADPSLSKSDLIDGYTLPHLDRLFTEEALRSAWRKLTVGYLGTNTAFFFTLCCLAFAEAMPRLRPGCPASPPFRR